MIDAERRCRETHANYSKKINQLEQGSGQRVEELQSLVEELESKLEELRSVKEIQLPMESRGIEVK